MTVHPYTRLFILPAPPTVDEDETEGYEIGDVVFSGGSFYDLSDASAGAAVWVPRGATDIAAEIHAATGSGGFVNDDEIGFWGSVSGLLRKITWATLINQIATYLVDAAIWVVDGDYITHDHTGGGGATVDHTTLSNIGSNTHATIDTHLANTSNPHSTTAAQVSAIPVDGWEARSETWTRTGNYTFTVSGDLTAILRKYTRVQYNDGALDYGVILSSSHAAGTTTINLLPNTNYAMAAATITAKYISYLPKPTGFPDFFNWSSAPTITLGSGTLVSKCTPGVDGWMDYELSLDISSTTMAAMNFTPPATCTLTGARTPVGVVAFLDASPAANSAGVVLNVGGTVFGVRAFDGAAATYVRQVAISSTIPFTWANSDGLYISGRYPY